MKNLLGDYQDHCIDSFVTDVQDKSIVIMITDTIQPYKEYKIECKEVIAFSFFRTEKDKYPYFCPEFSWQQCRNNDLHTILCQLNYPFYTCTDVTFREGFMGDIIVPMGDWVHLHFEGHVYGDIVCKSITVEETGNIIETD